MFRGNSYMDDPLFGDHVKKPGYSYLHQDVSDINKQDRNGNSFDSPSHQNNRGMEKNRYQNEIDLIKLQKNRDLKTEQYRQWFQNNRKGDNWYKQMREG